jgi:biotin carboxyl carrier protein
MSDTATTRQEVRVPDLGDFKDVEIVEVLVKPGDTVRLEQPLITLETDKAAMEVPSPWAGTIVELKAVQGGRVSTGDVVAVVAVAGGTGAPAAASPAAAAVAPAAVPVAGAPTPAPAAAAAPTGPSRIEVRVPSLGDFKDVEIVEVAVKPGDTVRAEQPLITLETDKAAMEVPAPATGRLVELKVAQGGACRRATSSPSSRAWPPPPGHRQPQRPRPRRRLCQRRRSRVRRQPQPLRPGLPAASSHPSMRRLSARPTRRPRCASSPGSSASTWAP